MTVTGDNHDGRRIDSQAGTALLSHDWNEGDSLANAIVSAIATLSGRTPDEMERLYDRIDPDSLEAIFEPTNGTTNRADGTLSFRLEGYAVIVHGSGTVLVAKNGRGEPGIP
ncbi:hypothetical protein EA462_17255 [Natrarchaeobius halalkaliphilus]|uniref:Halobacterial output domain-containing protein n=1 Tax=Natrarchaeobius halalkaliphilus TaxID=1679091 RepID=A0A3N6LM09_9EURY|nr:HalOD1 output domain-containing protein [Natrarchaeobius halalkaliphilus]RQG86101.1 hypothetical protein EA462_17255 [Natrarchaeobius halalkaliphilus]